MTSSGARLVGRSAAVRTLQREIETAARSDAKVLIVGESGTGKEVTARLIHTLSDRNRAPLIPINCAGVPESLLESELFGFRRGSFTGADRDKAGLLEIAHRGTAFLDEVGEMSMRMQGLLLRFLETGEIQRLGSEGTSVRTDVRIISATNRDLVDGVMTKAFRLDLFYRLNVVHLRTPPLRERREDIRPLIDHFLDAQSTAYRIAKPELTADALVTLEQYHWPGNVRQLKNIIERIIVARPAGPVGTAQLPEEIVEGAVTVPTLVPPAARAQALLDRMVVQGESFWSVVYGMFLMRDLTRDELRFIVATGLDRVGGNWTRLLALFNMPPEDLRRFTNFLKKHQCQIGGAPRACRPVPRPEAALAEAHVH